ncbi:MAG: divergent PAP2 family protein [Trueperaceae bacterium]|jgi:acid phosphatase family membrane protein YuiD|nr:divergent PAP2 family protein [Trueperaceae bacterium]MCO5172944.1 divergent PAP2 family protein [Trueperaceae bacterium]MCW5820730.1 divergent PAP2 family protein [Trueperaceae bacterium]
MSGVIGNLALWSAVVATVVAQVLKVALVLITERRFAPERLLDTGGMPSSHTASVTALATSIGLLYGWGSPTFAIAAVFGSIVMYDATGIRRAAGQQAEAINELVKELAHLFDAGFQPKALKTLLGHTYPQVFAGAVLGILTAVLIVL